MCSKSKHTLTIGQAADQLGVSPSWLRFGERLGSLPLASRTHRRPASLHLLRTSSGCGGSGVGERKRRLGADMSTTRDTNKYANRPDATPEADCPRSPTSYKFVLDCHAKKEAAPESRPDDAKGI